MYNTALIESMLNRQFQDRLRSEGMAWNINATFHGHPTQIEGMDRDLRPFYFRLRSNRATFLRGTINQGWFEMMDRPEVYINVTVPDGTTHEEAFFALLLQAERENGACNLDMVETRYNSTPVDLHKVTVIHRNMDTLVPV